MYLPSLGLSQILHNRTPPPLTIYPTVTSNNFYGYTPISQTLPHSDFSSPNLTDNSTVIDKNPKRSGYTACLNPKPPDDLECSVWSCLLTELRPVEVIKHAKLLSLEIEEVLHRHTRIPIINKLVHHLQFWDAEKTVCEVKNIYKRTSDQSLSHNTDSYKGERDPDCLSNVLTELVAIGDKGKYELSALGGTLFYPKKAFLDETLLRLAKYEVLPCSGVSDLARKPYMVLDAAALENLEIFEINKNGGSSGTLYAQLNHCVTTFGNRLLKTWLARLLYHIKMIRRSQDVVAALNCVNLPFALEFWKGLPDME